MKHYKHILKKYNNNTHDKLPLAHPNDIKIIRSILPELDKLTDQQIQFLYQDYSLKFFNSKWQTPRPEHEHTLKFYLMSENP